jgi:DNA-binding NtrC family response regulator
MQGVPVATPCPTHLGSVLVIADDPAVLRLLRQALIDDGYRVLTASGVAGGLAMLRTFRVDLVLTDAFRAPGDHDPWGSLARLRDRARGTPVVISSADTARSFAGYDKRGFAGLVTPPFDRNALSAVIRRTLDRDRAAHGRRHSIWEAVRKH